MSDADPRIDALAALMEELLTYPLDFDPIEGAAVEWLEVLDGLRPPAPPEPIVYARVPMIHTGGYR